MRTLLFVLGLVLAKPAVSYADVVRAYGSVTVDGREMANDDEIADRARDAVRKSPKVTALIQADKNVHYSRVIAVMDALKRGGVNDIAFSVAPR